MDNRFFSLIVVPDSGSEIKSGSFNHKFVFSIFGILIVSFLICLFFIVGFHIKLKQEKNYQSAILDMHTLLATIEQSRKAIQGITDSLEKIRIDDTALRQFAYMEVLDSGMYRAGVGGHDIVDNSVFDKFSKGYRENVRQTVLQTTLLEGRIRIQQRSLAEIYSKILRNLKEIDSTPSILPTLSFRITDDFRWRTHPVTGIREFHDAVDLGGKRGDPIYSTADGTVIFADRQGAVGKCVRIAHGFGFETLYGHLDKIEVVVGQKVKKNDIIGRMGSSGRTTGVHVHYSVSQFDKKVNPKQYFVN